MNPAVVILKNEFFPTLKNPINVPIQVAKIRDEIITFKLLSHPMKRAHA